MTLQTTKIHRPEENGGGTGLQTKSLRVGMLLWGRYEVTAVLGSSALGEMWRCLDRETGEDVSLRWLPPDLRRSKPVMAVIHAGIRRIADQKHPHLAAIRQMVYVGDHIYLVGDFAPGMDLQTWREKGLDGRRSLEEVLPVLRQAAEALDFAHSRRIVHRNLKPSNIYLDENGGVKVTDFGLAPHRHMSLRHGEARREGVTGSYQAPEIREDAGGDPDAASDQYAFAALAWELLTGEAPSDSPEAPPSDLPSSARTALRRALAPRPRNRYVSCSDFVRALGGERVSARRGRSAKEWQRIRLRIGVAAGLVIFTAGLWFGGRFLVEWMNRPKEKAEQPALTIQKPKPVEAVTIEEPAFVPPPPLVAETPLPEEGYPWVTQTGAIEFVWILDMQLWVARFELTNEQYRQMNPNHSSGKYKEQPLDDPLQPVVRVNFTDVHAYAEWLTEQERAAGKLPEGLRYRLPSREESIAYTIAGSGFEFPWGRKFPPVRGNYADVALGKAVPGTPVIPGYVDGFPVTAPVDRSGENAWGLFGAGGNVWETTSREAGSNEFGGWQGGGWDDYLPSRMKSVITYGFMGNARGAVNGVRLVLGRIEDEAPPPAEVTAERKEKEPNG